jgi:hypothetical protein
MLNKNRPCVESEALAAAVMKSTIFSVSTDVSEEYIAPIFRVEKVS